MSLTADTTGITWFRGEWSLPELTERKGSRTISVVVPALNEQETVGGVLASIRGLVGTLVDELIVVDSGSTDATIARARAAGATAVYTREQALPSLPPRPGKGEVLWRSLAVATGDLIVFIDSDLRDPDPRFVPSLVAPLLFDDRLRLVKGCYRRPLGHDPPATPMAAAASPSWSPGRCSPRSPPTSPTSCSRSAANTPRPATCSPPCRSRPDTASRSACCSTPGAATARPPSGRWTWAPGCIATAPPTNSP